MLKTNDSLPFLWISRCWKCWYICVCVSPAVLSLLNLYFIYCLLPICIWQGILDWNSWSVRHQALGIRVRHQGLDFGISVECWVSNIGYQRQASGFRCWASYIRHWAYDTGHWTLGISIRHWVLGVRHRGSGLEHCALGIRCRHQRRVLSIRH